MSNKKEGKKIVYVFAGCLVMFLLCVVGVLYYMQLQNFNKVKEYVKEKKYEKAVSIMENKTIFEDYKKYETECKYQIAIEDLKNDYEIYFVKEVLEDLGDYKESKKYLSECNYKLGLEYYKEGDFESAKKCFEIAINNYNVQKMLDNISILKKFQGGWFNERSDYGIEINGWKVSKIFYNLGNDGKYRIKSKFEPNNIDETSLQDNYFVAKDGSSFDTYKLENDRLIQYVLGDTNTSYEFIRSELSQEELKSPQIGMTSDEVRNSSWGNPEKINKTTNSYGMSEQWCYPHFKYIYIDNGIVTSIQE